MSPGVATVRADICGDCPTPCEPRPDVGDPCAACHLRRWGQHDCGPAPILPGDRVSSEIERRILRPVESYAPGIVKALRRCGGCGHAKHAMGSNQPHPDAGTVV
jgi:hypothetical protein